MICVVVIVSALFLYLLITAMTNTEKGLGLWWPSLLLMLAVPAMLFWILLWTYYVLDSKELKYVSGPIRGSIPVRKITTVVKNTTLWVGLKPATARNGLLIKYGTFEEIYISPVRRAEFIKLLLEYNPSIIVKSENV
jgi:hypothetical protein